MKWGVQPAVIAGVVVAALMGLTPNAGHAQGLNKVIEGVFPTQLVPGQTTVINMAMNGGRNNKVTAVQVTPNAGITIGTMTSREPTEGVVWWAIPITVAKDAAPGPRQLVAVGAEGPTTPWTLVVPAHMPTISDLKVLAAQVSQPTMEFQFTVADASNDLGDTVTVWFTLACGGEPELGVLNGTRTGTTVKVAAPNPRTRQKAGADPIGTRCTLEARASDTKGFDSNTLKTTVDFK